MIQCLVDKYNELKVYGDVIDNNRQFRSVGSINSSSISKLYNQNYQSNEFNKYKPIV